jgi:hypothetical protein
MNYLEAFLKKYAPPQTALEIAHEFLQDALSDWENHPIADIKRTAREAGISARTIERAATHWSIVKRPHRTWALKRPDLAKLEALYEDAIMPTRYLPLFISKKQLPLFVPAEQWPKAWGERKLAKG